MSNYHTEICPPSFSATVKKELDRRFSRSEALIAPSEGPLPFGLVLAKKEIGQYEPYQDGKDACAILISGLPASEEAQKGLILRGYSAINADALSWDASVTDRETALKQLAAHTFVIESVNGFTGSLHDQPAANPEATQPAANPEATEAENGSSE